MQHTITNHNGIITYQNHNRQATIHPPSRYAFPWETYKIHLSQNGKLKWHTKTGSLSNARRIARDWVNNP